VEIEEKKYLSYSPKGGGGKKKGKKRRVHSRKIGNNLSATRSSLYSSNFGTCAASRISFTVKRQLTASWKRCIFGGNAVRYVRLCE
jgi:hypothetical protein